MQLLNAPASSFSLSQTSSDIQFGDRNPALLCTDIPDCWFRNEYSVRHIITKLEQMVTHWNAILFQLVYGFTIYRPVCLFIYIKLQLELKAQWSVLKRLLTFSISYGNLMTSQCNQQLPIFICVGEFVHSVYLIFQTVLELSRNWSEM